MAGVMGALPTGEVVHTRSQPYSLPLADMWGLMNMSFASRTCNSTVAIVLRPKKHIPKKNISCLSIIFFICLGVRGSNGVQGLQVPHIREPVELRDAERIQMLDKTQKKVFCHIRTFSVLYKGHLGLTFVLASSLPLGLWPPSRQCTPWPSAWQNPYHFGFL